MKFSKSVAAIALAGLCATLSRAEENERNATVEIGFDLATAYVASGATCNDSFVFQPFIDIYDLKIGDVALPIEFDVWGNMDLDDYDKVPEDTDPGRFSEVDFQVRLNLASMFGWEDVSLYIGYLEYDYPLAGGDADNVFDAKIGYNFTSGEGDDKETLLSTSLRLKYRIGGPSEDKYEVFADINRGFDFNDTLGGKIGCEFVYINVDELDGCETDSGFACADIYAKLFFGDFTLACTYISRLDDEVLPSGAYGYDAKWIGTLGWCHAF